MKATLYTFGLLALALLFGVEVLAQNAIIVEPLTSVGVETGSQTGIGPFINKLYQYGVGIGAILAVLIIMYGGFRYMTSEAVGEKNAGREDIQRAVLGLLLILSPVIVFGVINRDILELDFNLGQLDYGGEAREPVNGGVGSPGGTGNTCTPFPTGQTTRIGTILASNIQNDPAVMTGRECCRLQENCQVTAQPTQTSNTTRTTYYCNCESADMRVRAKVFFTDGLVAGPFRGEQLRNEEIAQDICSQAQEANSPDEILSLQRDGSLSFTSPNMQRLLETKTIERLEIKGDIVCRI